MSVREWREARALALADLAHLAGVSKVTLIAIEHGRVTPKFRTRRRIAAALGVEPFEIDFTKRPATPPADATGDEGR